MDYKAEILNLAGLTVKNAAKSILKLISTRTASGKPLKVAAISDEYAFLSDHFIRFLNFAASVNLISFNADRSTFTILPFNSEPRALDLLDFLSSRPTPSLASLDAETQDLGIRTGIFNRLSNGLCFSGKAAESGSFIDDAYAIWGQNFVRVSSRLFSPECLMDALRTGEVQWAKAFGIDVKNPFDLRSHDERLFANLMQGMHQANSNEAELLKYQIHLESGSRVLDIGGASGALGSVLVRQYPNLESYRIYDLKSAIPVYRSISISNGIQPSNKLDWIAGDFFGESNNNCLQGLAAEDRFEAIILGWILHDWSDEDAITILRKAKAHLNPNGRMYILEALYGTEPQPRDTFLDMTMMVQTGGRERTENQFKDLFEKVNLSLTAVTKTTGRRDVLEVTHA